MAALLPGHWQKRLVDIHVERLRDSADCLQLIRVGPTVCHFAIQILNAAALVKEHPNLFLLTVSNFSCTIDAFTHSLLASELGSKPYLTLEIDAHTADAGVQTRLEPFLDIVQASYLLDSGGPDRLRHFVVAHPRHCGYLSQTDS